MKNITRLALIAAAAAALAVPTTASAQPVCLPIGFTGSEECIEVGHLF